MSDTGFVLVSSGVNVDDGGDAAWSDPSNITADDGQHARAQLLTSGKVSQRLEGLDPHNGSAFSAIGVGDTIDGIEVQIDRLDPVADADHISDHTIQLVKGGMPSGDNNADTVTAWPNTETLKTYGGATDLWNLTLSPADVKASNFGVAIKITTDTGSESGRVDAVWIKVYYTAGVVVPSGTSTPTLSSLTASASGRTPVVGQAAPSMAALTASATGSHTQTALTGQSAPSLEALSATAQATHAQTLTATATPTLAALSALAAGAETITAQATPDLAALMSSAAATEAMTAQAAPALGSVAAAAQAAETLSATAAPSLGALSAAASAVMQPAATPTPALGQITAETSATAASLNVAGLAQPLLSEITASASAAMQPAGTAVLVIGPFRVEAVAVHEFLFITDTDILQLPVDYQLAGQPPPIPGAFTAEGETRVTAKVRMRSGGRLSGGKSSFTVKTDNRGYD